MAIARGELICYVTQSYLTLSLPLNFYIIPRPLVQPWNTECAHHPPSALLRVNDFIPACSFPIMLYSAVVLSNKI